MISMETQPTFRTMMLTNAKIFLFSVSTLGTILARVSGINLDQLTPGAFSLVREFLDKGTPTRIVNLFSESHSRKTFDVEIFDRDQVVMLNKMRRDLVLKIGTLIENLLMNVAENGNRFSATVRSLLSAGNPTLCDTELPLSRFVAPRIINLSPVRERGEGLNANVDTDSVINGGERIGGNVITRYYSEPSAALAFDADLFDRSNDFAVQSYFDQSDVTEAQFAIYKLKPLSIEEKTIETLGGLEARIARTLTRLTSSVKRPKSLINLAKGLVTHARLYIEIVSVYLANAGELLDLIVQGNVDTVQFPSVPAFLHGGIVEIAAQPQMPLQSSDLFFVGIQPKCVGQTHG